jgi:hypothetical protein
LSFSDDDALPETQTQPSAPANPEENSQPARGLQIFFHLPGILSLPHYRAGSIEISGQHGRRTASATVSNTSDDDGSIRSHQLTLDGRAAYDTAYAVDAGDDVEVPTMAHGEAVVDIEASVSISPPAPPLEQDTSELNPDIAPMEEIAITPDIPDEEAPGRNQADRMCPE